MSSLNERPILVVDDDPTITATMVAILRIYGLNPVSADSGELAIRKAQEMKPALILMDVNMPGMNGVDAAVKIKEMLPETDILIWTGMPEWGTYAEEKGFSTFLTKPAHPDQLRDVLRQHGFDPKSSSSRT